MNFSTVIPEVINHAYETTPHECCGVVIVFKGKYKYIPCRNLLQGDVFCIDPEDYANAEDLGEIVAIAHSHPNGNTEPSSADIISCNRSQLPWIIVTLPQNSFSVIYPKEFNTPLIGRPFYHGVLDCYSLIRDYYREILKIELSDYLREPNWWDKGQDLYLDNFKKEGFVEVQDLRPHDIILMQNGSSKVNHGAIYIGDNLILHHSSNRLSSRDVYGGYWRKNTRCIIRHETLL